jgi:hypothetical protein
MKAWLRQHPEHIPPGLDATKTNAWGLRDGLRKRGWSVNETATEVRLTPPRGPLPERLTDGPLVQDSEREQKMNEEGSAEKLVSAAGAHLEPHEDESTRSLLHELSTDHPEVRLPPPGGPLPERLTDSPLVQDSERTQRMNEEGFVERLVSGVAPHLVPHKVEPKRSLLYELSVDACGNVIIGVDPVSGEPIRGSGRALEQDILVFDEVTGGHTCVIPLIAAEVKFGAVTTHDVLVYAEKADRIRRVYPYLRYGFVLGGLRRIPGRVIRLGQRFDFIVVLSSELRPAEMNAFCQLMREEAEISKTLTELLFGERKPTVVRKRLEVGYDDESSPNP